MEKTKRYQVFATDYDGTLAKEGTVAVPTIEALERLKRSGRKCLLVTGRQLPDLYQIFPRLDLFDVVVAENGALLLWPGTGEKKLLCPPPPEGLLSALRDQNIPFVMGEAVLATWRPHEVGTQNAIRQLRLPLHIILNKNAIMVLPTGVDKASGMLEALRALKLPSDEVVAVGDAQNDLSFMEISGLAVAVANALPLVKERADLVTARERSAGVAELIDRILSDDLP